MSSPKPPSQDKPLSRTNSRILLTSMILCTVFLAYLAALGIKAAGENKKFQEAMEIMQQNEDPRSQLLQGRIDSLDVPASNGDSLNHDDSLLAPLN